MCKAYAPSKGAWCAQGNDNASNEKAKIDDSTEGRPPVEKVASRSGFHFLAYA